MPLSLLTLADTFLNWLTRTNQLVTISNQLTEGALNSSGSITITNPSGISGNVSLNVANGLIRGDAGLISNVRTSVLSGLITNAQLQNNRINLVSNSTSLIVSGGNASIGNTAYLSLAVSTSNSDVSIINVASANIVNSSREIAIGAFVAANNSGVVVAPAFGQANAAYGQANGAFARANIAIANANFVNTAVQSSFTQANDAFARANVAIANTNFVNTAVQSAYAYANTVNITADLAATRANANDQMFLYLSGQLDVYTTETFVPYNFQPFRIEGAYVICRAGALNITFQKNGLTIGGAGDLSVATTGVYYPFSTNNTIGTGDTVSFVLSNNTSADEDMGIALLVQRTVW
jgi:hypothetical protein